jgi:hypothetical protein
VRRARGADISTLVGRCTRITRGTWVSRSASACGRRLDISSGVGSRTSSDGIGVVASDRPVVSKVHVFIRLDAHNIGKLLDLFDHLLVEVTNVSVEVAMTNSKSTLDGVVEVSSGCVSIGSSRGSRCVLSDGRSYCDDLALGIAFFQRIGLGMASDTVAARKAPHCFMVGINGSRIGSRLQLDDVSPRDILGSVVCTHHCGKASEKQQGAKHCEESMKFTIKERLSREDGLKE